MAIEPFGIIAGHMGGHVGEARGRERAALVLFEGGRREARTVGEPVDFRHIETTLDLEHAEQDGAAGRGTHHMGRRGAAAQGVVDQSRNGGTVARSGETVA